ncbi:MAG TPA: hypothetical protein VNW94_27885 [Streptosporangiaceae bacterium]|nr:hypothetical protein [Streptosporangiaceae bacterium]
MAILHHIPEAEITTRPWPAWLTLACLSDRELLNAEWTPQTLMDRRGFMIVAGLSAVLAQAAGAPAASARSTGRRISATVPTLFEQSLAVPRREDDQFGSYTPPPAPNSH